MTILCALGLTGYLMLFEEKFIFYPSKYPEGQWGSIKKITKVGDIALQIEDSWLTTSDKVKLHGWHCTKGKIENGEVTRILEPSVILWFHGNAGNISDRYDKILKMMTLPTDIFIFDYRGYGRSEGSPSEKGLYLDAEAAWTHLLEKLNYQEKQVIIYGNSLGGVPAIELASKVDALGLIAQSSFTSARDMAGRVMPIMPKFLIRTKMNSIDKISKVSMRKLFIHSVRDEVIPYSHGKRLYEKAQAPKEFYKIFNAGHNEIYLVEGKTYFFKIKDFITKCIEN